MEQSPHIVVQGLGYSYHSTAQPVVALVDLILQVGRGEIVSIIGPSGCGKTTLLRVVAGLLEPTRGTVLMDGVCPRVGQRRKIIGYVSQDPALLPWRTVKRNVALPSEVNMRGEGTDDEVDQVLSRVGLLEFKNHYPYQLSGGMKRRVAFARALFMDPEVLLLDEPLASLDEITRASMRYELLRLWEDSQKTIILVTHSITEAVMMSDRVVVLSQRPGRVICDIGIGLSRPRLETLERTKPYLDYSDFIRQALMIGSVDGPENFSDIISD